MVRSPRATGWTCLQQLIRLVEGSKRGISGEVAAVLLAHPCLFTQEIGEPEVAELAAPAGFHPGQAQVFEAQGVEADRKLMRGFPVEGGALVCDPAVEPGQVDPGFAESIAAFLFLRKAAVSAAHLSQALF